MKLRNKKTGEILEDVKYIDTSLTTVEIHYLDNGISRMETEKDYHSFLQNWEDYTPQEPLIKDENIRKAVKTWAYINSVKTLTYDEIEGDRRLNVFFFEDTADENVIIQFYGWIPTLKDGEEYSIAELCGEE